LPPDRVIDLEALAISVKPDVRESGQGNTEGTPSNGRGHRRDYTQVSKQLDKDIVRYSQKWETNTDEVPKRTKGVTTGELSQR